MSTSPTTNTGSRILPYPTTPLFGNPASLFETLRKQVNLAASFGLSLINSISRTCSKLSSKDVMLLVPKEIQCSLNELYALEKHPEVEQGPLAALACKIDNCAMSFLSAHRELLQNSPEKQAALLSIHQMAKVLKSATPCSEKIWVKLSPDVKNLFNIFIPFINPPDQESSRSMRWCHSMISLPSEAFLGRFADNCTFKLRKDKQFQGYVRFALPDHPNCFLYHTPAASWLDLNACLALAENLPPRIEDIFDADSVKMKIDRGRPFNDITLKLLHQILIMHKAYMDMILGSLGIPVHRPLALGNKGEWIIFGPETFKCLKTDDPLENNPDQLQKLSKAIRAVIELEVKLGLKLLALPEDILPLTPSNPDLANAIFKTSGSSIVCGIPLLKMEFLPDPLSERVTLIRITLENHCPKPLIEEIFKEPFQTEPKSHGRAFIEQILKEKIIEFDDLLHPSPAVISLWQAFQQAFQKDPSILAHIPWSRLGDPESLRLYLVLIPHAMPPLNDTSNPDILFEHIFCLSKKMILETPRRINPKNDQLPIPTNFEAVVNNLLRDKMTLTNLIIKYLFAAYSHTTDIAFPHFLEKTVGDDKTGLFGALAENLNLEADKVPDLKTTCWCVGPNGASYTPSQYFWLIFWQEFMDNIEEIHGRHADETKIEDSLSLLRSAWSLSKSVPARQLKVQTALMNVLHNHMISMENRTLANQLNETLNNFYKHEGTNAS